MAWTQSLPIQTATDLPAWQEKIILASEHGNEPASKSGPVCSNFHPLPGLEKEAILTTRGAVGEAIRVELGRKLACRILERELDLVQDRDTWHLVDPATGLPVLYEDGQLHQVDPGGALGACLDPRAAAYASLLLRTSLPRNHMAGILTSKENPSHPDQAEGFLGGLCAHKWSLRLDPNWMAAMRSRSLAKARQRFRAMLKSMPKREKRLRTKRDRSGRLPATRLYDSLLTLTQSHRGLDTTLDQLRVFNRAFHGLTLSELWTKTVYGGVKGIEDKLDPDGPHVHGHLLLCHRWIDRHQLRREWWLQLDQARRKLGFSGLEYMPGGLPVVDIRLVKKIMPAGRELPGHVSQDSALNEVSKYITKTADLVQPDSQGRYIPAAVLLEQCEVRRWPRMFELLGACRERTAKRPSTFLDTSCISVARAVRDALTQAREPEEGPIKEPRAEERGGEREAIRWVWDYQKGEWKAKQKARPPTWRDLMDTLPFPDWLHVMMGRAERGYRYRLNWILEHNPLCFLVNLDGKLVAHQEPT